MEKIFQSKAGEASAAIRKALTVKQALNERQPPVTKNQLKASSLKNR